MGSSIGRATDTICDLRGKIKSSSRSEGSRRMPAAPDAVRVLVIDDDKALAATIVESLERKGYACSLATSGKAGAAKIQAEEFDIVLTDLRMSDLDGLTIVKKVREALPEAEVAVITGFNDV